MTDRDRLVELLKDTLHEWECDVSIKTVTEIAEHLISNGVIVPPCKVGDTVYVVYDGDYEEYVVKELCCGTLGSFGAYAECNIHGYNNIFQCGEKYCGHSACKTSFELREFGKTVFLTREEAEKALNDMEVDESQ